MEKGELMPMMLMGVLGRWRVKLFMRINSSLSPFLQVWNTRCRLRIMNILVMYLLLTRCGEENFIYSLR